MKRYGIIKIGDNMKKIKLFDLEYDIVKDEHDVFNLEEVTSLATEFIRDKIFR